MKRRDWKIKKLIKGIYGKKKIKKLIKTPKLMNLRKLFMKKNSVLTKKNLVINYFFYNRLLKSFKFKKNNYFNNYFFFTHINYNLFYPNFFLKKKLFNFDKDFKKLLIENKMSYFFVNKNFRKFFDQNNNNIIILNNSEFFKNLILNNKNEDILLPIDVKYFNLPEIVNKNTDINYFLNFNINIILATEIYKLLIILYLDKLK